MPAVRHQKFRCTKFYFLACMANPARKQALTYLFPALQLGRRPVDRTNEPCIIKMLHEFEAHHQGGGGGQSSRPQPQARPSGEAPRRTSQAGEQPQKSRWEGEGPGQGRWQQKGGPGGQSSSSDNGRSQQRYEQPSPPQTVSSKSGAWSHDGPWDLMWP